MSAAKWNGKMSSCGNFFFMPDKVGMNLRSGKENHESNVQIFRILY